MVDLNNPISMVCCPVCDNLVPMPDWPDHLRADFRLLDIIKITHPEWGRHKCEDYLRSISATGAQRKSERLWSGAPMGELFEKEQGASWLKGWPLDA